MEQKVIGVRFKKAGKIYFFDPGDDEIEKGDSVIVETARGLECGDVVIGVRTMEVSDEPECPIAQGVRRIHRKATKADLTRVAENRAKEKKAFDICVEKISEHGLPMNLINVAYTFDVNKIIFYFTADGRVDFRALVRDLAYIFHTRIELRQVGVRDEAKLLGGVGCCGRPLCCATFLGDFAPVSIRMAKEQNLSLNPTKISGICGRLLCCLKYESDFYHESYIENNQDFRPKKGDRVVLADGEGEVKFTNNSKRIATILLDNGETVTASWEDLLPADNGNEVPPVVKIPAPIEETETKILESADTKIEAPIYPPPAENQEQPPAENYFDRQKKPNRRKDYKKNPRVESHDENRVENLYEKPGKGFKRPPRRTFKPKDFRK